MSQRAVEGVLGRLLTDEEFRCRFYREPGAACSDEGFEITERELQALSALPRGSLESFATELDARIVRAAASRENWLPPRHPALLKPAASARHK